MRLYFLFASIVLAIGIQAQAQQTSLGSILLDDFSQGDRLNAQAAPNNGGQPAPIWSLYQGEDSGQRLSFSNNEMVVTASPNTGCGSTGCGIYVQFMPAPYVQPKGHAEDWIMSGNWNPAANRLRFRYSCSAAIQPLNSSLNPSYSGDPGGNLYVGTYIKPLTDLSQSNQGQHYYHTLGGGVYPGHWVLVELNGHPNHEVGGSNTAVIPNNPELTNPTEGAAVNYFDGLTRFYIDTLGGIRQGYNPPDAWSGVSCNFKDFSFDTDTSGSPDDLVSNITATYNGSRYELTWNGQQMQNTKYQVYYSRSSMKTSGLNSGTLAGTVQAPGSSYPGDTQTAIAIPSDYAPNGMYFAIQPVSGSGSQVCSYPCFTEVYLPPFDSSSEVTSNPSGGGVSSGGASSSSGTSSSAANRCDLNGDGKVDQTDVNVAINAALTNAATPNLDGTGHANVVDIQRVVNASLGGTCRVGS